MGHMANVTKIKFQYFKPLEKGTMEHTGGGERKAGTGGHGRVGHPLVGPRRRGPRGRDSGHRVLGKRRDLAEARPSPHDRQRRPDSPATGLKQAASGRPQPRGLPAPVVPWLRRAAGSRRSRRLLHCHRDPTRRQRLPRERPSAPGARGKSPCAPMNDRLPHDGHARRRGFPSPLPSSGNPL